jgi:hypothetical protein
VPGEAGRIRQQRREPLHPPMRGDVVDVDAALGQQLLHVPERQAVPQVPAHRQHDRFGREPGPGESRRDGSEGRPAKAARANRLSSATKLRSSTTPTVSSSTTTYRSETPPTPRNSPPRSNASPTASDAHHARSPPIAATARPASNATYTTSAFTASPFPAKTNPASPAANSNTDAPSATRSNGEPDQKVGSTTSNAATAGTAPN